MPRLRHLYLIAGALENLAGRRMPEPYFEICRSVSDAAAHQADG